MLRVEILISSKSKFNIVHKFLHFVTLIELRHWVITLGPAVEASCPNGVLKILKGGDGSLRVETSGSQIIIGFQDVFKWCKWVQDGTLL